MILKVIKPDGSLIHHPHICGVVEPPSGDLVLMHKDGTERLYEKGTWSTFKGEKELITIDIIPIRPQLGP